eukprot:737512-Pleurochrysis_carterae.AAC.3
MIFALQIGLGPYLVCCTKTKVISQRNVRSRPTTANKLLGLTVNKRRCIHRQSPRSGECSKSTKGTWSKEVGTMAGSEANEEGSSEGKVAGKTRGRGQEVKKIREETTKAPSSE